MLWVACVFVAKSREGSPPGHVSTFQSFWTWTHMNIQSAKQYGFQDLVASHETSDMSWECPPILLFGPAYAFPGQKNGTKEWRICLAMMVRNRDIAEEYSLKIAFMLFQGFTVFLATIFPQTSVVTKHDFFPGPMPSCMLVYFCLSTYRVYSEGIIPNPPLPLIRGRGWRGWWKLVENWSSGDEKWKGWTQRYRLQSHNKGFKQ